VLTYNFVTNVVKKRLEHSRVLLEILFALTFPLGKADTVSGDVGEKPSIKVRTNLSGMYIIQGNTSTRCAPGAEASDARSLKA